MEELMAREVFRYGFDEHVALKQLQDLLSLAIVAAEGVHGQAQVRLDAAFLLDENKRALVIDAGALRPRPEAVVR
jgi:hypothetical protein